MPVLMKPREYAQYVGLSVWRIRQMIKAGELATTRIGKRHYLLVDQSDRLLGCRAVNETAPVIKPTATDDWFSKRKEELLAKCQGR